MSFSITSLLLFFYYISTIYLIHASIQFFYSSVYSISDSVFVDCHIFYISYISIFLWILILYLNHKALSLRQTMRDS